MKAPNSIAADIMHGYGKHSAGVLFGDPRQAGLIFIHYNRF